MRKNARSDGVQVLHFSADNMPGELERGARVGMRPIVRALRWNRGNDGARHPVLVAQRGKTEGVQHERRLIGGQRIYGRRISRLGKYGNGRAVYGARLLQLAVAGG